MTTLAAIVDARAGAPSEDVVRRMLASARVSGDAVPSVASAGAAALGASAARWELRDGLAGREIVVREEGLSVAADAALYYVEDLRRRLAGVGLQPAGDAPAQLIAAAYRAWGEECVRHLEGDYAFIVWDSRSGVLFAARDFNGSRPLHFAQCGSALVLGTTAGAVLTHPDCPADLDLGAILGAAGFLAPAAYDTGYARVVTLQAGHCLRWTRASEQVSTTPFWEPPEFVGEQRVRQSFGDAAAELRALLEAAVAERMPADVPTAVTLSGGWDSSAIYAVGQTVLAARGAPPETLRAVSMSYPPGDLGREDELIASILDFWKTRTHWVQIGDAPLIDGLRERVAVRDEVHGHGYETFNRVLAAGVRESGARVVLNGFGGDQWFQAEPFYLADLVSRGRILRAVREWRRIGGEGWRAWAQWSVLPLLGERMLRAASRVRGGRPLMRPLDLTYPDWLRADAIRRYGLEDRMRVRTPSRRRVGGLAAYEKLYYATHPYFSRILSLLARLSLEEGVELRVPLCDERVLRFAASRPRTDRREARETKRLLRAAVKGLLPDAFLAPRTYRTGTTGDYFDRELRLGLRPLASALFAESALASLGLIDPHAYLRAVDAYLAGDGSLGPPLYFTLQAELWVRSRADRDVQGLERTLALHEYHVV